MTAPRQPSMRDLCIAYEAQRIVVRALAHGESMSYDEGARKAFEVVDLACERGELGLLYHSWARDPDAAEATE